MCWRGLTINVWTTHIMSCHTLSTQTHTHTQHFLSLTYSLLFLFPCSVLLSTSHLPSLSLSPHHYPLLSSDVMCSKSSCMPPIVWSLILILSCGKCICFFSSTTSSLCVCVCVCVCVRVCVCACGVIMCDVCMSLWSITYCTYVC